ncbi:MAG: transposase [Polyangiales bacterium]
MLDARRRQPIDVEAWVLARRTRDQARSRAVIVECKGCAVFGRMIAIRLPRPQAKKARRRLLKEKGKDASERDLLWSEYVVVFTTVPAEMLSDEAILALYRLRWQVELHIKRDKSLGGLDRLPNFRPDTIEGWVSAKLLLGALARRMVCEAFPPKPSPTGEVPCSLPEEVEPCTPKQWALLKIVHQLLSTALLPITLDAFLGLAPSIAERLRSNHPPSRPAALAACLEFLRKCVA